MAWTWHRERDASGMVDVAAPVNAIFAGDVVTCGSDGSIWYLSNGRFAKDTVAIGFRRVARSPDGVWLIGVATDGTVWFSKAPNKWVRFDGQPALGAPVEDAVVDYDNSLWITLSNGQMWSMRDGRTWEWRTVLDGFKRLAVGRGEQWWGIDRAGRLLRRDGNHGPEGDFWRDTKGSGPFEDITVGLDGKVWLVGTDGSVWHTADGERFTKVTDAAGHLSVSAQSDAILWSIGKNGTMWSYVWTPDQAPPAGGGGGQRPPQALLTLEVSDQSQTFGIVDVVWRIWRQGFGEPVELPQLTGATAATALPAQGQYQIHADVRVSQPGHNIAQLAEFIGNGPMIDGLRSSVVVWSGIAQTKQFRLVDVGDGNNVNPQVQQLN